MDMIFCPLFSGSSGNALFVQYGSTRLLIDAGKPGKTVASAMELIGVEPDSLDGVLITHEHSDHISGAGVLARKYHVPVYATEDTWAAMDRKVGEIPAGLRRTFDKRTDFYLGDIGVVPFAIPHDAADPVGYRLWGGSASISTARNASLAVRPLETVVPVPGASSGVIASTSKLRWMPAVPSEAISMARRMISSIPYLSMTLMGNTVMPDSFIRTRSSGSMSRPPICTHFWGST